MGLFGKQVGDGQADVGLVGRQEMDRQVWGWLGNK